MESRFFTFNCNPITLDELDDIISLGLEVKLGPEALKRIAHCRQYLDDKMKDPEKPVYGITTGFGSLCNRTISADSLSKLQENLVKSHACSVGDEISPDIVRLMMLLKIHALSLGHSGVSIQTVERIITLYNLGVIPVVYESGSLGASGDLAPLANLFLPLIGLGEVNYEGKRRQASEVMKELDLEPLKLQSKEGLALLNGTQFMSSHGVMALLRARRISRMADLIASVSLEAFDGLDAPFNDLLAKVRPHAGIAATSRNIRNILKGSELTAQAKKQVQDPYSFRCIPQVHGASKDAIAYATDVITTEINSVTDNPTIFPDEDLILSGGNFHGQPIAMVFDYLAIALSELGNISERRCAQLILGMRDLPEFLVVNPGLNSGYMIPQYAAAALVSKNKMYCFAASSDSIVSSNGQEDHVSMGANAATKLIHILDNLEIILAIEMLEATQALNFRRPAKSSPIIEKFVKDFTDKVPIVTDDEVMYLRINKARDFLKNYTLPEF